MASWISVYSQFTQEALLFQALAISILCCGYAAFWVLRKRRFGVAGDAIPAGVVKGYLNELIRDAETMRAQLFGLLRAAGVQMEPGMTQANYASTHVHPGESGVNDGALVQKIIALENKMSEQARTMEAALLDKKKIEAELSQARAASATAEGAGGDAGGDPALMASLQGKIEALEGRLAEYSIIEDDLANLKRLQQENAQLRAALQRAGIPIPELAAGTAPSAIAAAAANSQVAVEALATGMQTNSTALPTVEAGSGATSIASPAFDGLVDQVEKSLQPDTPITAEPSSLPDMGEKSDADLVAEFEKMLKA